jgi:hypothetical protein
MQSNAKQSKAKQCKAMQSKAMQSKAKQLWADLDKMINLASFFADFRPLGAHGGPGEPWDGPRPENQRRLHHKSDPETSYKARAWVLCVFGAGRKNMKRYMINMSPHGQPSKG